MRSFGNQFKLRSILYANRQDICKKKSSRLPAEILRFYERKESRYLQSASIKLRTCSRNGFAIRGGCTVALKLPNERRRALARCGGRAPGPGAGPGEGRPPASVLRPELGPPLRSRLSAAKLPEHCQAALEICFFCFSLAFSNSSTSRPSFFVLFESRNALRGSRGRPSSAEKIRHRIDANVSDFITSDEI